MYVSQITSVYLYKFCVDVQLLLHSTVSNSHINVRLEVSHKQKLYEVTGYKYTLHFLYKLVGSSPKKFKF